MEEKDPQEIISELLKENRELQSKLAFEEALFNQVINSDSWRITKPLRDIGFGLRFFNKTVRYLKQHGLRQTNIKIKEKLKNNIGGIYTLSCFNTISKIQRELEENEAFSKDIKFSILVPLYNTPINFLKEMIKSVQQQTYRNWELCLADGSDSQHKRVGKTVKKLASKDNRIKYKKLEKNLGISENTNACINMSTGDYIALFDHDDLLHPSALYEVMKEICTKNADFIYTDEATFLSNKNYEVFNRHYKPDYAIDTLRSNNYICHLSVFSKQLLDKVGYFNKEYDGSQDHDLILRLTEKANCIKHIPKILYFWRAHKKSTALSANNKNYAALAGRKAVMASIKRAGMEAEVESSTIHPNIYRVRYKIKNCDKVSIIITTKNHYSDLHRCLDSIFNLTTYQNYEVIVIDNGSDDEQLFDYYKALKQHKNVFIYNYNIEFNYSKINNFGASKATGKYFILLNNDTQVITPNWIEEMLMYVQRDDVAAAGAKLYYFDNTIQHGGVIIGLGGVAAHAFNNFPKTSIGYQGRLNYVQDLSAVTAACMMVKASVYHELNGLDETFKVAFNDTDFCMRIRKAGYLIVWTPFAELYHYESKSRGLDDTPEKKKRFESECLLFKARWAKELETGDPYYNPNLTLDKSDFSFKG